MKSQGALAPVGRNGARRRARCPLNASGGTAGFLCGELPAVVGERLVRLGHLLDVVAALHRGPDAVAGVEDLVGQALGHGLLPPLAGVADGPADGEGVGPAGPDLDGNLVGRATDAAALDLERRLDVLDGPLERGRRLAAGLLLDRVESVVD